MAGNMLAKTVYLGTFVHSKSLKELEISHETAIFVDENGKIVAIKKSVANQDAARSFFPELGWSESEDGKIPIVMCGGEQFFFPGFIGNLLF